MLSIFSVYFLSLTLLKDLDWKVVYVGSAEEQTKDQVLEEVSVGPVPVGISKFVFQAPAPDPSLISDGDLIGVTVVLVTCSYHDHEFVRVGYYVNNEYTEPYEEGTLPSPIEISKIERNILAAEPRVTRFAIDWTGNGLSVPQNQDGTEQVISNENEANAGEDIVDFDAMDDEEGEEEGDDDDDDNAEIDLDDDEGMNESAVQTGSSADGVEQEVPENEGDMSAIMMEDSNSMDVGLMQSHQAVASSSLY